MRRSDDEVREELKRVKEVKKITPYGVAWDMFNAREGALRWVLNEETRLNERVV